VRSALVAVPYVPLFVTVLFRGMPGIWTGRHRRMRCWLVGMQALVPGHKPWEELARWPPAQVTAWRVRRGRTASYWQGHLLGEWWGQAALHTLPPPQDGDIPLGGDGSDKPTRGLQHPLAQQGRKRAHQPWCFGMRLALLIVHWDSDRLPVACRRMRPQGPPEYPPEQALCREMGGRFVPPPWAKRVIVAGDAASGSQEHIQRVQQRDADEATRRWGGVFAIARPWKTVAEKALKDLVTHLPRLYSPRTRVPRLPGAQGGKTCWV
jgi:hypothetical protein